MSSAIHGRHQVDVAIIGTGTAGMSAYKEVCKQTERVLVLEAHHYGTTCARVGCMPSKLLIAAAEQAGADKRAGVFGIHYDQARINGEEVMARVRSERDRFVAHAIDSVAAWPNQHKRRASARFIDNNTLALSDGTQVDAQAVVVCTGSRARVPAQFSALGKRVITSDDIFEWQTLPESVAVFGGGVIGLELGQALHRLGVHTRIFGKDGKVAQLQDPEVLVAARQLITGLYPFIPDARVMNMRETTDGIDISFETQPGKRQTERFEQVLVAVGRVPNLDSLELANTTLELDEHGRPTQVDSSGRCADTSIYLAGDVHDGPPLLHLASLRGKEAGNRALSTGNGSDWTPPTLLAITFSDPQIMSVGQPWSDLQEQSPAIAIGQVDWSEQGRARVLDVNAGLLRVYGDPVTGKLLGAEMIGPRAEHLAHLLAWAIESGLTVKECLARPYYHPCFEEGLRTALRQLADSMNPNDTLSTPLSIDCGPGC